MTIIVLKPKKEESLLIGDSYEADIVRAQEAGIEAVFFNEQNIEVEKNSLKYEKLGALVNNLYNMITDAHTDIIFV